MAERLESKAFLKQVRPIWSLLPLGMTLFFLCFWGDFLGKFTICKTSEKKQANLRKVIPNILYTDSRWQRVLIEFTLRRWSLKGHTGECYFTRGEESNENQLCLIPVLRCHTQASSWRPAVTAGVVGWWTRLMSP